MKSEAEGVKIRVHTPVWCHITAQYTGCMETEHARTLTEIATEAALLLRACRCIQGAVTLPIHTWGRL